MGIKKRKKRFRPVLRSSLSWPKRACVAEGLATPLCRGRFKAEGPARQAVGHIFHGNMRWRTDVGKQFPEPETLAGTYWMETVGEKISP